MNTEIIGQMASKGVVIKRSEISQRLGPPGQYFIQLIVNGIELIEDVCPHFTDPRVVQKWCQRHPKTTSIINLKKGAQ